MHIHTSWKTCVSNSVFIDILIFTYIKVFYGAIAFLYMVSECHYFTILSIFYFLMTAPRKLVIRRVLDESYFILESVRSSKFHDNYHRSRGEWKLERRGHWNWGSLCDCLIYNSEARQARHGGLQKFKRGQNTF